MTFGCIGTPFEFKFLDEKQSAPGTFEGYGAVFGNMDSHGDVIEPGAFGASLTSRKASGRPLPPMYKQHGMVGDGRDPVGVWEAMSEDASGLHVKGRLVGLDTERGKFTYAQAKEGALGGLSIGYRVMPNGSRKGTGRIGEPSRFLKALHLSEVSLVDDPSNALAQVTNIKGAAEDVVAAAKWLKKAIALHEGHMNGSVPTSDKSQKEMMVQMMSAYALLTDNAQQSSMPPMKTIRDFEDFLRDAGFSNAAAKAIAAGGYKAKPDPRDEDGIGDLIRERMEALATLIRA